MLTSMTANPLVPTAGEVSTTVMTGIALFAVIAVVLGLVYWFLRYPKRRSTHSVQQQSNATGRSDNR